MVSRRIPAIVTLLGLACVIAVWVLTQLDVWRFGQEPNIGRGALLLLGYILTLGGIVSLTTLWLAERSSHKK